MFLPLYISFQIKPWFRFDLVAFSQFLAMPPWQSWSHSSWNNWRDDKSTYQHTGDEAQQYPEVEIPQSWKSTNTLKRGLTGLGPLKVPIGLLTRHGASEFGLRTLSNGRFFGIISCRNVPETVFGSQLLRAIREAQIDLDSIAESLHRKLDPKQVVPSKTEPAVFVEPLIHKVVDLLKSLQPDRAESSAIRRLQTLQAELEAAQNKLKEAGLSSATTEALPPEIGEEGPEEESEGTRPTKRKSPSTSSLGATPKRKARRTETDPPPVGSLDKVFESQQEKAAQGRHMATPPKSGSEAPTFTAEEMLTPGKASLKDQPPTGSSDVTIKKWLQQYPQETQQMVVKLQATISESKPKKDELQTAAIQYGLNLNLVNKMSVPSLLKAISLGALQAA